MKKNEKILISVLAVVLVLLATVGVAFAAAPRDFLQLVLSDGAYTKVMLAKNLSTTYPAAEKVIAKLEENKLAFKADGTVTAAFNEDAFGDKKSSDAVSNYVSSLKLNADLAVDGTLAKVDYTISDSDAPVVTVSSALDPTGLYMNVNQLGLGWLNMSGKKDFDQYGVGTANETYENLVKSKTDKVLREAIYGHAEKFLNKIPSDSISIASEKELQVGSLKAKGDVVTVILTADELRNCINVAAESISDDKNTFEKINSCVPSDEQLSYDEYKGKVLKIRDKLLEKTEKADLKTANLDFFVNRKNKIVALKLDLSSESVTNQISLIITDEKDRGISLKIEDNNEISFLLDVLINDKKSGKVVLQKTTERGPIHVEATYSDLVIKGDKLSGHFVTEPFELPGENELGSITLDLKVTGSPSSLDILFKTDIEKFGSTEISLKAEKVSFKSFTTPKAAEISPYDRDTFKESSVNYLLKSMPETHPSFRVVYADILTSSINGAVGDLISALTGNENSLGRMLGKLVNGDDLSNAIGGIIDSAIKGDTTGIGNIISDFFKAFGLKGSD